MFWMKKCPYCNEWIKSRAIRCKHCRTSLGENRYASAKKKADDGIQYLQNGFAKINSECQKIEEKMKLKTGFVFIKHQYSGDELYYALGRIESFVEKMSTDLDEWESVGKLNQQVRFLFNQKAEETCHRLESLHYLIEQREATWWEKVSVIFKRIIEMLIPFIPLDMIIGKAKLNLDSAA